jgi:hypothetical protein
MRRILTKKVDEKGFDNVNPSMLVMMVEYVDQNLDQGSNFTSKIKVLGIASKQMGL